MWKRRTCVVLLSWAISACTLGESAATVDSRTVEQHEIKVVGTSARFVDVRDAFLLDGSLWVLDAAPPFLSRVNLGNGEVLQFGGEGQGPGEFLSPQAIQPAGVPADHGILVWDAGTGLVTTMAQNGTFRESARVREEGRVRARSSIREVSYVNPFRVRMEGGAFILGHFPRRIDRTSDLARGSLRRTTPHMELGTELVSFSDHTAGNAWTLREWAAIPLWDACDAAVAMWSGSVPKIV